MRTTAYFVGQLVAVLERHGHIDAAQFDGDPVALMDAVSEFGQGREIEPFIDAIPRAALSTWLLSSADERADFREGYHSQGGNRQ